MSVCKILDGEHDTNEKKASVHKLRDAFEELTRLQNEHKERIKLCDEDIEKFKKFKDDYLHLQKRLISLPDKTSHEVMVPIGSLAFMPGRLVHTNEIIVLLGDNWFVERSAKQATGIVSRRIRDVNEKLESVESARKLHENWLKEAEELSHGNAGEQVEIIEGPFDEQEVQKSKDETRRKLKEYNTKLRKEDKTKNKSNESNKENAKRSRKINDKGTGLDISNVNKGSSNNKDINISEDKSHENLMNRLDELYQQEQTNKELESISDHDIEDVDGINMINDQVGEIKIEDVEESESEDLTEESEDLTEESTDDELEYYENNEETLSKQPRLKRRVSWADDNPPYETIIPDNSSEDIFRIQYSPSKLCNVDEESSAIKITEDSKNSSCVNINSPSDLYKAFIVGSSIPQSPSHESVVASHDIAFSPRGILKKKSNRSLQTHNVLTDDLGWRYATEYVEAVTEETDDTIARPPTPPRYSNRVQSDVPLENSEDNHSLEPAFKYSVIARDDQNDTQIIPVKNAVKANDSSNSEPKKVSRFKASRINKT